MNPAQLHFCCSPPPPLSLLSAQSVWWLGNPPSPTNWKIHAAQEGDLGAHTFTLSYRCLQVCWKWEFSPTTFDYFSISAESEPPETLCNSSKTHFLKRKLQTQVHNSFLRLISSSLLGDALAFPPQCFATLQAPISPHATQVQPHSH